MATLSSILGSTFQGDVGPQGPEGPQGPTGDAATIAVGNVFTSAPGSNAEVSNTGTSSNAVLDFTIPRGGGLTSAQGSALAIALG